MEIEQIEKDILELREKLEKSKEENVSIRKIDHYEEFQIINQTNKYMSFNEKNIFIVAKNKNDIKTYEIYNKNKELIAKTDENGLLKFEDKYKEMLKDSLKDYYNNLGLDDEERKIYLHEHSYIQEDEKDENYASKENGYTVSDKPKEDLSKEAKEEEIKEIRKNSSKRSDVIEPTLIQEDLGIDVKNLEGITKIQDKRFYNKVPKARDYDEDAILVYNNKTNKFMIIGMQNGKYVECNAIEPSVGTTKTSVDIDKNGENIKERAISGIMKIKNSDEYDFAVNFNGMGEIEFKELRMDRNGQYISTDLDVQGKKKTAKEVENIMDKNRNNYIEDEIEEFRLEQEQGKKSDVNSLKEKKALNEEHEIHERPEERERVPYEDYEKRDET